MCERRYALYICAAIFVLNERFTVKKLPYANRDGTGEIGADKRKI